MYSYVCSSNNHENYSLKLNETTSNYNNASDI